MADDTAAAATAAASSSGEGKGGHSQRRGKRDRAERDGVGASGGGSGGKMNGDIGSSSDTPAPASVPGDSSGVVALAVAASTDSVNNGDKNANDKESGEGVGVGGKGKKSKATGGKKAKRENSQDVNMEEIAVGDDRKEGMTSINNSISNSDDVGELGSSGDQDHGQQQQQQQQQNPPEASAASKDIDIEANTKEIINANGTTTKAQESNPPPSSLDEKISSTETPNKSSASPPNNKSNSNTPKGSKYCIHESCTRYRQSGCFGYCLTHRQKADPNLHAIKRNIAEHTSEIKKRTLNRSNLCKWPSCTKYIQSNCNGYCLTHVKYANYEEGDVYDVTKVRIRICTRLQNGFCRAILPPEVRNRWGFEVGGDSSGKANGGEASSMKDTAGDGMNGTVGKMGGGGGGGGSSSGGDKGDGENNLSGGGVGSSNQLQDDSMLDLLPEAAPNGAPKCRVVDCPENSIDVSHGFCRKHYNRYEGKEPKTPSKDANEMVESENNIVLGLTAEGGYRSPRTYVPPEHLAQLSIEPILNDRGRTLCKIVGCGKMDQSNNDGFCRMHFHMFAVREKSDDDWTCGCGILMAGTQKRCGTCNKWRGGRREPYSETTSEDAEDDGEPWTCECGNEVASKKSRCGSCHHWRGGRRQGGWTLGSGKEYDSDDGIDRTQDWTCCGVTISANQSRCGKCNGWRGGKRVGGSTPPNLPPWVCIKCQVSNPGNKKRCGGCLTWKSNAPTSKPSKGSRKSSSNRSSTDEVDPNVGGHWKCMGCNFDNFAAELSCFICQSMRSNHQWHKKQQIINSNPTKSNPPIQSTGATIATHSAPTLAAAFANPTAGVVPPGQLLCTSLPETHRGSIAPFLTDAIADSMSNQGVSAPDPIIHVANDRHIFVADAFSNPPDTLNYYGTHNENLIYPFIRIHYDFNRAYYYNHDYTYLNAGVGSIRGGGGDGGTDSRSNRREDE